MAADIEVNLLNRIQHAVNRVLRQCARTLPASPIAVARSGSSSRELTAIASALASCGGTRMPVSPSATVSGRPPTLVATTGRPEAIASIATIPCPSVYDGTTTSVEQPRIADTSVLWPRKWTRGWVLALDLMATSSGPEPAIKRCVSGCFADTSSKASNRVCTPFSLDILPTKVSTLAFGASSKPN